MQHFLRIENGRRMIALHAAIEVEWDDDEGGSGALALIFPGPGFEPNAPHVILLEGRDAEVAWAYFQARDRETREQMQREMLEQAVSK